MKIHFLGCIFMMLCCYSYGQTTVSGIIYEDSTMTSTISNVKVIFKAINKKKIDFGKSDKNGNFSFLINHADNEYVVIIKRKKYTTIKIGTFPVAENIHNIYLKIILKKMLSIHDKNFDGISKLISVEQK